MSGSHSSSDESSDSRKRPPDRILSTEPNPKRPNCDDAVHLKVLIPSIAAGAVIGKRGGAIANIQKETNAKVKISKPDDFYPGTSERVCLVVGTFEGVMHVHNYIMECILEKPDPNPYATGEGRLNVERHKQVKILVPNSTAGMVIGRNGIHIQEIKEKTGAYVQVSQKSRDYNLLERCIIIAGDLEQTRAAVRLILRVIASDPQSSSYPNLSYHDICGPVASAYPTGSPYAAQAVQDASAVPNWLSVQSSVSPIASPHSTLDPSSMAAIALMTPYLSHPSSSLSRPPAIATGAASPGQMCFIPTATPAPLYPSLSGLLGSLAASAATSGGNLLLTGHAAPPNLFEEASAAQAVQSTPISLLTPAATVPGQRRLPEEAERLQASAYASITGPGERTSTAFTPRPSLQPQQPSLSSGTAGSIPSPGSLAANLPNSLMNVLSLASLTSASSAPSFLTQQQHRSADHLAGLNTSPSGVAAMAASFLLAARTGSGGTTSPTSITGLDGGPVTTGGPVLGMYNLSAAPSPPLSSLPIAPAVDHGVPTSACPDVYKHMILVPETVIGILLGPHGRIFMELQSRTGTTIQLSQKGMYIPGTENRVVSVTGPQVGVQWVTNLIEHYIASEHLLRESSASTEYELPGIPGNPRVTTSMATPVGTFQTDPLSAFSSSSQLSQLVSVTSPDQGPAVLVQSSSGTDEPPRALQPVSTRHSIPTEPSPGDTQSPT